MSTGNIGFPIIFSRLLDARGWKQLEAAEKIGIGQGIISAYRRGKSAPTMDNLIRIADALGVSVDELCGRKEVSQAVVLEARTANPLPHPGVALLDEIRRKWTKADHPGRIILEHELRRLVPKSADLVLTWLKEPS
jgi:transcriptional regulator with XRE-family HTH domain